MDESDENTGLIQATLNNFALKLFSEISKQNDTNLMISPYGISMALAMCYFGSRNQTSGELKELLGLEKLSDEQIIAMDSSYSSFLMSGLGHNTSLKLINKLYLNSKLQVNSDFQEKIIKSFSSEIESVEFSESVANHINAWMSDKTESKFDNCVEAGEVSDASLSLVLVNAVYFKANWSHVFEEGLTKHDADFYTHDGRVAKCDMMELRRQIFKLNTNPMGMRAKVLEIPYDNFTLSCTIILPDNDFHLDEIIDKLRDASALNTLLRSNHELNSLVNVHLPKFTINTRFDLCKTMQKLGCATPFDKQRADFSSMKQQQQQQQQQEKESSASPMCISKLIHQTIIDVDEHGTEASTSASTFMRLGCAMNREAPFEFVCNRPFLFIIHEKNHNGVLFMGKFVKP